MKLWKIGVRDIVFLILGAFVFAAWVWLDSSRRYHGFEEPELFVQPACDPAGDCIIAIEYGDSKFYLAIPRPETTEHLTPFR